VKLLVIIGKLHCSLRSEYFVESELGKLWLLDVPSNLKEEVDRLLYDRVTVKGGRTGPSTMSVAAISSASP